MTFYLESKGSFYGAGTVTIIILIILFLAVTLSALESRLTLDDY